MPALQVKAFPEDLHRALAQRAREEGLTIAEYVTRVLRRDLERPSIAEWLERHPAAGEPRHIDVSQAIDHVRAEYAPEDREKSDDVASAAESHPRQATGQAPRP